MTLCMEIGRSNIKVTCPTRIDFTGGFTDVMPFRATQWVSHVNLAIDLLVGVVIEPGSDGLIKLKDNRDHEFVTFTSVDKIDERFSLIRAALRNFEIDSDITVRVDSCAPCGAGLGTSGALSVALVAALMLFTGQTLPGDKSEIATMAAEVERISGVRGGLQDQFAAATGGLNLFQFYKAEYSSRRISLSDQHIKELEQHVLILYPGGNRRSTDLVAGVMEEYYNGNPAVRGALSSLNELALKMANVLESAEWKKLSFLIRDVREQQLMLHPDLIDDSNQQIINDLYKSDIEGVKLLGGGGGGACLLAVSVNDVSRSAIENICEMHNVNIIPVRYAKKGVQAKVKSTMLVI